MTNALRCLAAKTSDTNDKTQWIPFWLHSMDTAHVIRFLAGEWLSEHERVVIAPDELLGKLCVFAAMVHDIGKMTYAFQWDISMHIPGQREQLNNRSLLTTGQPFAERERTTHAKAGASILQSLQCPETLSGVVGSHHGKPLDSRVREQDEFSRFSSHYYGSSAEKREWTALWQEWFAFSLSFAGLSSTAELPDLSMEAQLLLSGLLIMADWIASNQTYFPPIDRDMELSVEDAVQRAEQAWSQLRLPGFWDVQCYSWDESRFEDQFSFPPNAVQRAMAEAVEQSSDPGLFILEAQMGIGKTEAALAAAEMLNTGKQCGGLFFGLPTQATANGIFSRLKPWAEKQSEETALAMRLAHGAAELNDEYRQMFHGCAQLANDGESGLLVHSWFQGRKQALLADFVVGTVDQLLMASLRQKHFMLRHIGLAGKVIIIDECHAYDAYMNSYLDRTLNWLGMYGTPVILLSATLPAKRRAELVDAYLNRKRPPAEPWRGSAAYPLLTWTDGADVHQYQIPVETAATTVAVREIESGALAECLAERMSEGGCAGIIVNTVAKAAALAETLQKLLPTFDVQLYHAQFIMPDRAKREADLMKRVGKGSTPETRDGLIVVGTQVLEQSLDLDFDLMISELCPMDLLLQRMGRLHRHRRSRPQKLTLPQFFVIREENGEPDSGSLAIYGAWLLQRTRKLLSSQVTLPGDIPVLVQAAYAEPEADCDDPAWTTYRNQEKEKKKNARDYCIKEPVPPERRQRTQTLTGFLQNDVGNSANAEAAVRDGDPSIEVLVLMQRENGTIGFLPWQHDGAEIDLTQVPPDELARRIASQRLRLPHRFCVPWAIDSTIKELERGSQFSAQLQQSPWLKGELFLLLDQNGEADLGNTRLQYSREYGLTTRKGDDTDGTDV